jgi:hypothetical protein
MGAVLVSRSGGLESRSGGGGRMNAGRMNEGVNAGRGDGKIRGQ